MLLFKMSFAIFFSLSNVYSNEIRDRHDFSQGYVQYLDYVVPNFFNFNYSCEGSDYESLDYESPKFYFYLDSNNINNIRIGRPLRTKIVLNKNSAPRFSDYNYEFNGEEFRLKKPITSDTEGCIPCNFEVLATMNPSQSLYLRFIISDFDGKSFFLKAFHLYDTQDPKLEDESYLVGEGFCHKRQ